MHLCDSGWKYADSKVLPSTDEFNVPFNKYTIACFITMHMKISNSPTQSNSYDCGVFVCLVSYPLQLYEYIILTCIT